MTNTLAGAPQAKGKSKFDTLTAQAVAVVLIILGVVKFVKEAKSNSAA